MNAIGRQVGVFARKQRVVRVELGVRGLQRHGVIGAIVERRSIAQGDVATTTGLAPIGIETAQKTVPVAIARGIIDTHVETNLGRLGHVEAATTRRQDPRLRAHHGIEIDRSRKGVAGTKPQAQRCRSQIPREGIGVLPFVQKARRLPGRLLFEKENDARRAPGQCVRGAHLDGHLGGRFGAAGRRQQRETEQDGLASYRLEVSSGQRGGVHYPSAMRVAVSSAAYGRNG
jgi:hypothetical protein